MVSKTIEQLPAFLLILIFLVIWETVCRVFGIPNFLLPPPTAIAKTIIVEFTKFYPHILATLQEMLLGLGISIVLGVVLAFLMFRYPIIERAFFPIVIGSQAIPVFAIAPLLVLWFGYGISSKVIMTAIIVLFPIVVNTLDGLKSTDPDMVYLLKSMGASENQILFKVRLPQSLPFFFSGLKIGVSVSSIGAVIGEWVGSTKGLGYLMLYANAQLRVDIVFASIFYLTFLAVSLYLLVSRISKWVTPWLYLEQEISKTEEVPT